ncbi:hypothetical protein PIB30_009340 [Stylosanthes scabra]|uniref:Uncharacterized protein n=1 Tax=Stylosanthes scabra TaxID=79078 RepID=A0ABU6U420_9FABA|nr:hypothetical protein [Stylosanthes scabra]
MSNCSGLVSWRRGPPRMCLGFKEGGLGFQEVDQAWNGGVDLQGHSDAQAGHLAKRSSSNASWLQRGRTRLDQAWNNGGGPARPLRHSSLEDGVTTSGVVRIVDDRILNGYFDGSMKQKLDSASWLVAGLLTSSLQKEISADCKEVTKASG